LRIVLAHRGIDATEVDSRAVAVPWGVRWIVDGMNVIGSRPDGWWKDRSGAMVALVEKLERWAEANGPNAGDVGDVTVVFERPPSTAIPEARIEVTHAPTAAANSADDEIVKLVEADARPHEIRIVTSDKVLADRVRSLGASVYPAKTFRELIDPRDVQ
jgi:predicted RNA-binding protein with PIN domain